jgi:hypothetical protein
VLFSDLNDLRLGGCTALVVCRSFAADAAPPPPTSSPPLHDLFFGAMDGGAMMATNEARELLLELKRSFWLPPFSVRLISRHISRLV